MKKVIQIIVLAVLSISATYANNQHERTITSSAQATPRYVFNPSLADVESFDISPKLVDVFLPEPQFIDFNLKLIGRDDLIVNVYYAENFLLITPLDNLGNGQYTGRFQVTSAIPGGSYNDFRVIATNREGQKTFQDFGVTVQVNNIPPAFEVAALKTDNTANLAKIGKQINFDATVMAVPDAKVDVFYNYYKSSFQCDMQQDIIAVDFITVKDTAERQAEIQAFKEKSENTENLCGFFILKNSSDEKWSITGFNDTKEFQEVLMNDNAHPLAQVLNTVPLDSNRIIELAAELLGHTLARTPLFLTALEKRNSSNASEDFIGLFQIPQGVPPGHYNQFFMAAENAKDRVETPIDDSVLISNECSTLNVTVTEKANNAEPEGAAIANAAIHIANNNYQTQQDGKVSIENLPAWAHYVDISADHFVSLRKKIDKLNCMRPSTVAYSLESALCDMRVQINDQTSGNAIPDAKLSIDTTTFTQEVQDNTITLPITITGFAGNEQNWRAAAVDYHAKTGVFNHLCAGSASITLSRCADAQVLFNFIDNNAEAGVAGITIDVFDDASAKQGSTTTSAQGSAQFDISKSGVYSYTVSSSEEYKTDNSAEQRTFSVDLCSAQTPEPITEAVKSCKQQVKVTSNNTDSDTQGQISTISIANKEYAIDSNGFANFLSQPEGDLNWEVKADNFVTQTGTFTNLSCGQSANLPDIVLQPCSGGNISFNVASNGDPVSGIPVINRSSPAAQQVSRETLSNNAGDVTFSNLANGSYKFSVVPFHHQISGSQSEFDFAVAACDPPDKNHKPVAVEACVLQDVEITQSFSDGASVNGVKLVVGLGSSTSPSSTWRGRQGGSPSSSKLFNFKGYSQAAINEFGDIQYEVSATNFRTLHGKFSDLKCTEKGSTPRLNIVSNIIIQPTIPTDTPGTPAPQIPGTPSPQTPGGVTSGTQATGLQSPVGVPVLVQQSSP